MTPRQADVLTAIGLVALLAAVSLTAPRWSALLHAPLAVFEDEGGSAVAPSPSPDPGGEVARRISVRLYFGAPETPGLLPEERTIPFSVDLAPQVRTLVEELVKGPTSGLLPTLPAQTRVLAVFVTGRGVAYVDLSRDATALAGGSQEELLTVYSIVDSLVANFPAVGRVQILVEDRIVPSLSGHIDLSRPLPADMTLVALPAIPAAPGEPAPSGVAP